MILRNTPHTVRVNIYSEGDLTDADGNSVTVTVEEADGTDIVTAQAATRDGVGLYSYIIPAQADLNELTATWTGNLGGNAFTLTTQHSIVGAHLFTEAEARAMYDSDLNATDYSDDDIAEARERITDEFEHIMEVAPVLRFRRETYAGDGTRSLWVKRPQVSTVLTATVGSTSLTPSTDITIKDHGELFRTSGVWSSATISNPLNITVEYEHGYDPPPPDLKRAALILARFQLVKDVQGVGVPEQASSWTDETGNYVSFAASVASGRFYGIPAVDNALRRYSLRTPVG